MIRRVRLTMKTIKLNIWGREFELEVIFDCFDDEKISVLQQEALEAVKTSDCFFDTSLDSLKEYCLNKDADLFQEKEINNIFKYVIPTSLYLVRNDKYREAALLCEYRFDADHGIAIDYINEQLNEIGTQDLVL